MSIKKFLIGTLVGGIAFFFLGFILYAVAFESFFMAHAGSATGVAKTEMEWWPLILGNLALAALFACIFLSWANIRTFGGGMKAGAIVGFLMVLSFDMIMYDTTNIMDLTGTLGDVVVFTIMSTLGGGVTGWAVGLGGD